MKKILQSALIWAIPSLLFAQTIPNGSFENWTITPLYELPSTGGVTDVLTSNIQTYYEYNLTNVSRVDLGAGNSAVRLESIESSGDTLSSFLIFGSFPDEDEGGNGDTLQFPGGAPVNEVVTSITIRARYSIDPSSPGFILAYFSKNGQPVGVGTGESGPGNYVIPLSGDVLTFTELTIPILPTLPINPDSVSIAIGSNDLLSGNDISFPGDFVEVDFIRLNTTVASIPGGEFNTWEMETTPEEPDNWFTFSSPFAEPNFSKSSQASDGLSSIKLETALINGDTVVGLVSIGDFDQNGDEFKEGIGVTSPGTHTLSFDYKYNGMVTDSGAAILVVTRDNGPIEDTIFAELIFLDDQGTFTSETSSSFDVQVGDSILLVFFSSWTGAESPNDNFEIGSSLWIDNVSIDLVVGLETQNTPDISIYPNPIENQATINLNDDVSVESIEVYNASGSLIRTIANMENSNTIINLEDQPSGIYQVVINTLESTITKKIVKQ